MTPEEMAAMSEAAQRLLAETERPQPTREFEVGERVSSTLHGRAVIVDREPDGRCVIEFQQTVQLTVPADEFEPDDPEEAEE